MSYLPLGVTTNFSFLMGFSQPENLAKHLAEIGIGACTIIDNSLGGSVQFNNEFKKRGIKAILGSKLNIEGGTVSLLAKNRQGWNQIARLLSQHNLKNSNQIALSEIVEAYDGSFMVLSGQMGSDLSNATLEEEGRYLDPKINIKGKARINTLLFEYKKFGEDFYLEIQRSDSLTPAVNLTSDILRRMGMIRKVKMVACAPSNYPRKSDSIDHRCLLYTHLDTIADNAVAKAIKRGETNLLPFLKTYNYYVRDYKEMCSLYTLDELASTLEIESKCEAYDLQGPPILPNFTCSGGLSPQDHLIKLCRDNWKEKTEYVKKEDYKAYGDRFKKELKVFSEAGLAPYFLIVQDYINEAKKRGDLVGPGRGSAAGCLIAFLLNITMIDPIKYGLIFERFFNAGRIGSYPDIDADFPIKSRHLVLEYLRKKYGHAQVAQVMTYIKIKGRGALKEAMASSGKLEFWEINKITEKIPDEASISDELQRMKKEQGESSIIKWALQNAPDDFSAWVKLEDGKLSGDYANEFAQGIRLEGCRKSQGRHPAAVVLTDKPIDNLFPMCYDKSSEDAIINMSYEDTEYMGGVKLDILGVAGLDKIMGVQKLLAGGNFEDD